MFWLLLVLVVGLAVGAYFWFEYHANQLVEVKAKLAELETKIEEFGKNIVKKF